MLESYHPLNVYPVLLAVGITPESVPLIVVNTPVAPFFVYKTVEPLILSHVPTLNVNLG